MKERKSLFFKSLAVVLSLCLIFVTIQRVHAANTKGVVNYGSKGIKVGIPGLQLTSEETLPTDAGLAAGRIFWDTTDKLQIYDGSGWLTVAYGAAAGNTLDNAYDQGSAGAGRKITADSGAVEIEVADDLGTGALLLDMNDSTQNPDVFTITNAGSGADIVAQSFSLTAGALVSNTSVTTAAVVCYGAGTNASLTIDAKGNGTITIGATSTGAVTIVRSLELTGDLDINGNDLTSAGDLVITPGGGQVDFSVADIAVDGGKKIGLNGITSLGNDFIILTGSNVVIDAAADIVLDPAGGDIDCDGADLQLDIGKKLSLNGATETDVLYSNTDLQIEAAADVVISPTGGQVDFNATDIAVDSAKKIGLNGIGSLGADFLYLSTNVTLNATADIELVCGGGQLDVSGGDVHVDSGKKYGFNGASLTNDFIILTGSNIVIDAAADIVLDAGGGQVDVNEADLTVDSGKKLGLNGIANLANDFISYNGTDVIIDAAADIKLNGSVSVDVEAALTVGTTVTITGNLTANGAIIGDGATTITGTTRTITISTGGGQNAIASQSGTVFYNDQAAEFDLPADPTGLTFTFVVANASALHLDPNSSDIFVYDGCAAGDRLTSSTVGDTITIFGLNSTTWYVISVGAADGDYTDSVWTDDDA